METSPPLLVVNIEAPLISIQVAAMALGCSETEVRRLLDEGALRGFNIATKAAGRAFVRIITQSVADHKSGKVSAHPANASLRQIFSHHNFQQDKEQFDNVLKTIFPLPADSVSEFHLAKRFGTDATHIGNLTKGGCLRLAVGQGRCRGRGRSPMVEKASIVRFLKERQL